jgi:hypothetical protein
MNPLAHRRKQTAWDNCWVVAGVLVSLPFLPQRRMCLPVLARLWRPQHPDRTKLTLAVELVRLVAARCPDRAVHVTADAAYAGRALRSLPTGVTVTTRLRCDAAYMSSPRHPPASPAGRAPRARGCQSSSSAPR